MPAQATRGKAAEETSDFGRFGIDTTVNSPHGRATVLLESPQGNLRDGWRDADHEGFSAEATTGLVWARETTSWPFALSRLPIKPAISASVKTSRSINDSVSRSSSSRCS